MVLVPIQHLYCKLSAHSALNIVTDRSSSSISSVKRYYQSCWSQIQHIWLSKQGQQFFVVYALQQMYFYSWTIFMIYKYGYRKVGTVTVMQQIQYRHYRMENC
jgi:hypothetical protein